MPTQEIFTAKCTQARNMAMEQSSMECEQVSSAFVQCRDLCSQAPTAEFVGAKGDDGFKVRDSCAELALSEVFQRLTEFASVDEIETLRCQYQQRYITIVSTGCQLALLGKGIPNSFTLHAEFQSMVQAMGEFLRSSVQDRFHAMEGGKFFKANFEDGQSLLTWSDQLVTRIKCKNAASLTSVAGELMTKSPPEGNILNPKMLSDKTLQNSLVRNPNRDDLNPLTQTIQD